jgi:F0F1-type ATP synthase membrane subunit c/vacuolar-type H+-ATPase subunit K
MPFASLPLHAQATTSPKPMVLSEAQVGQRFQEGNEAYKNADYKRARQCYEELVQSGVESAEVYFNLGNCYYKSGKIASAILNYHRAQRLDPTDDDISFNLSLAESRITDKIDPAPQFFIVKWWRMLVGLQTAGVWSSIGIVGIWSLFIAAGIFFVSSSPTLKKAMFTTGIVALVMISLMFIFAYRQHKTTMRDESAIVFAPSVSVKSEPQEESKDLFVLHEGTHVEVLGGDGAWCKVRIADGSVGWLRRNTIEII